MALANEDIKLLLDSQFQFNFNDPLTREQLEKYLPGAVCDEKLNTPDIVESKILMFDYNGFRYQYESAGGWDTQLTWTKLSKV